MRMNEERVYILKCVSRPFNAENYITVEQIEMTTEECVTVSDMVDNFNKLLQIMGFYAKVDVVEETERDVPLIDEVFDELV